MCGEWLGYASSIMFIICGVPGAYDAYKKGTARGMSITMLVFWALGEIALAGYGIYLNFAIPILLNAGINLICLSIMLRYYFLPRRKDG